MSSDFEQIRVSNAKTVVKVQDSCLAPAVLIRLHQCTKILMCESSKDFFILEFIVFHFLLHFFRFLWYSRKFLPNSS